MYYHRRYLEDGSCRIICTHCFQTLGTVTGFAAIKHIEALHVCNVSPHPKQRDNAIHLVSPAKSGDQCSAYPNRIIGLPVLALLLGAPVVLYAMPTALEFLLQRFTGPWVPGVLLGDLTACICLFTIFRMRRTGLLLYLVLVTAKVCLYAAQAIPANIMLWMADSIPAVFVLIEIARLRTNAALRASC